MNINKEGVELEARKIAGISDGDPTPPPPDLTNVIIQLIIQLLQCGLPLILATRRLNRRGPLVRREISIAVKQHVQVDRQEEVERAVLARCGELGEEDVRKLIS